LLPGLSRISALAFLPYPLANVLDHLLDVALERRAKDARAREDRICVARVESDRSCEALHECAGALGEPLETRCAK
jgi:hypothetical protein